MSQDRISVETQSLMDAQDHPFVLIDDNYNIVAANTAYKQAYGVEYREIVGHKCHKISHHSDVPCHMNGEDCPHKQVFATRAPCQVVHIHYDTNAHPEYVRIKGSPIFGREGAMYLGEAVFPLACSEGHDGEEQRLTGHSKVFMECIENLMRAAAGTAPVLLMGEVGVGKDLAAEYIHRHSDRSNHPFATVDCNALSGPVFESELFGHERGAFTGCIGCRHGLFEQADGGTLFFNEIADLSPPLQARLLRTLESGQFRRVGGHEPLSVDVRIICATARNLRQLVARNRFHAELYYHIAGILCEIPPLRNRKEDIPEIAGTLLQYMSQGNSTTYHLSDDALETLTHHDYPGNVRELRDILQRAATLGSNGIISAGDIHIEPSGGYSAAQGTYPFISPDEPEPSIKGLESRYIAELLAEHQGKRAQVAQILGISERTLYRKLKQYGLQSIGRSA